MGDNSRYYCCQRLKFLSEGTYTKIWVQDNSNLDDAYKKASLELATGKTLMLSKKQLLFFTSSPM
jgi:hypothetical protein